MSILKTIPIALDLKRVGAQSQALPTLVEGDNGNVFVITLTDNGEPLNLENASRVICVFSKTSDGLTVEQDTDDGSVTVGGADHNVITIELKAGSYGAGTNNCEVQIYSGDNSDILVTTANFNFRGRKGIMNDETIQSEDKYPILVSLIQQVTAALAAALPYTNVTASAALLPPGSTATASVTVGEDSAAFAFGIPEAVEITSVALISGDHSPGTTDVYRMSLSDGTHVDFGVYNGADGEGSPGTSLPKALGTASAGSAVAYSREDHVHPMPSADDIPTDSVGVSVQDSLDSKATTATYTATIGTTWEGADAVHEATGAIVEFVAEESMALVDLSAEINAVQNLNGYDKPWAGGSAANKWDEVWEQGSIDNDTGADKVASTGIRCKNYIPVVAGESYYLYTDNYTLRYHYYDENHGYVSTGTVKNSILTIPSGVSYMRIRSTGTYGDVYKNDWAVNYPATVTTYSPYANICPISGWDDVKVTRTGKNLIDDSKRYVSNNMTVYVGAESSGYTVALPAGTYTISVDFSGELYGMYYREVNDSANTALWYSGVSTTEKTFTIEDGIYRFWVYRNTASGGVDPTKIIHVQIELGSTATAYEAYDGDTYTIDLDGTRYGGSLDVTTGVLTVDRAMVDLGTLSWTYRSNLSGMSAALSPTAKDKFNAICSIYPFKGSYSDTQDKECGYVYNNNIFVKDSDYTDAATFKTAMNGVQLVYELATPQTVQLTAEQVDTLVGQNVIWADSGDVDVQYKVTSSQVPYSQVVFVSGLLTTDNPIVDIVPSDTFATAETQLEAWGSIYRIVTGANQITVYATEETSVSIPIQLKCVR